MVRLRQTYSTWFIWLFALQPIALVAESAPYIFEHLTIEQGLSHNTVYAVLQDRFGMMWFATHNGLNKYDGYGFKVFNTSSKTDPAFEGRIITTLLEDRNGHIWVGTQNRGVNILDLNSGKFKASRKHPQLSALSDTWITRLF
ncbi:MAG TPA: two-component regulator propeller domain-containing protein, partial [Rhodothermales bacterium]|nr:two-component regulator propeller domain-containing protein [Rhodothermales bacterium]